MSKTKLYLGHMPLILRDLKYLLDNEAGILSHIAKLKGQRSLSYATGRALLKHALINEGLLCNESLLPKIIYSELGKPKIDLNHVNFNLSHSQNLMALALGFNSLGVDIEQCDERRLKPCLLNRVLSEVELSYLNNQSSISDKALFFIRQWTLRECFLKALGLSIFNMDKLVIDPNHNKISTKDAIQGIIASFNINVHEYFGDNDKIYQLNDFNKTSSNHLYLEASNFIDSPLDYAYQDVKRSNDGSLYFQLSVFLELAYDYYDNLEQAVTDNLEIWLYIDSDKNIGAFKQINYVPQTIFTVN